jgi:hypothetical protein
MKTFILILTAVIFLSTGCKKNSEEDTKYCWQVVDNTGNKLVVICDKTETELKDCIQNNICGIFNIGTVTDCNYYKAGGDKFCWNINNNYYRDYTETEAAFRARCGLVTTPPIKVDCNFVCERWYNRTKRTYKPANTTTYSMVRIENYCGDTLTTLYPGRQIILKNDMDSLVVFQFSRNGVDW